MLFFLSSAERWTTKTATQKTWNRISQVEKHHGWLECFSCEFFSFFPQTRWTWCTVSTFSFLFLYSKLAIVTFCKIKQISITMMSIATAVDRAAIDDLVRKKQIRFHHLQNDSMRDLSAVWTKTQFWSETLEDLN